MVWVRKHRVTALSLLIAATSAAHAVLPETVVWHCSKSIPVSKVAHEDSFNLAVFGLSSESIPLTLHELISAYEGRQVIIDGRPLTVCLYKSELDRPEALATLGVDRPFDLMSDKKSHQHRNFRVVANPEAMTDCVERNFPAVGYLNSVKETEKMTSCF